MEEILPNKVYTRPEVQEILRIKEWSYKLLVRGGQLVPTRAGKRFLFLGSEILRFLKSGNQAQQSII